MRIKQTEAQLGEGVVRWLEDLKLDVYQEVELKWTGGRCDVVAIRDERWVWTIELKMRFGLEVLAQAERWLRCGYAHRSSIAIPTPPATDALRLGMQIADTLGVGILVCGGEFGPVNELMAPRFLRAPQSGALLSALEEGHKTAAKAGTNGGGHWTPFRSTCRALSEFVAANPGAKLKDAIDGIKHHYASNASARAHLSHWIDRGLVEAVELRRDDAGRITLWPKPITFPGQVKL